MSLLLSLASKYLKIWSFSIFEVDIIGLKEMFILQIYTLTGARIIRKSMCPLLVFGALFADVQIWYVFKTSVCI